MRTSTGLSPRAMGYRGNDPDAQGNNIKTWASGRPGPFATGCGKMAAALLGTALLMGGVASPAAAASCEKLLNAIVPNGSITAAQSIPAGDYTAPSGTVYPNMPAFCRVAATLTPTSDSFIRIEVWMPKNDWNNAYLATGGGGYTGTINYGELSGGLAQGFATANTDMGTSPATALDGRALTGHLQKQIDFAYRSTHLMNILAKKLIADFYSQDPEYSYYYGCSTGGGQGMHIVEQYPDDYDGVVAGAPAINRTHSGTFWNFFVTHESPDSIIPEDKATLVTDAVLAACATKSGGLATDTFLTDPRACHWRPESLACPSNATDTSSCLTPGQARALNLVYDGSHNPRTGHLIFPGMMRGAESGYTFDLPALEGLSPFFPSDVPLFPGTYYWVFGNNWDYRDFDFDHDQAEVDRQKGFLNALDTDLTPFASHGGKLIMFHGFADALISPQMTIDYYLLVQRALQQEDQDQAQALADEQSFFRLFLAPGMGHCSGGPGPNAFGQLGGTPVPADAQHDVLRALVRWVKTGEPPSQVVATKYVNDNPANGVLITRPLCPFPKLPQYKGSGDPTDAASFACVDDGVHHNPTPAPEYLKD
jgi:feruloyl esterase